MKLVISEKGIFIFLLAIMPLVDTINGIVMEKVSVGQFYRLFLFFFLVLLYLKYRRKQAVSFVIIFLTWCAAQFAVGISNGMENVLVTFKLFLPMAILLAMNTMQKLGKILDADIYKIFDIWSLIYPITIILPYVLGIGTHAYDGTTGTKGFYYALNEISFVICAIIMNQIVKINNKLKLKTAVLLILNCLSMVLMGTKTGYVTLILFFILYFFYIGKGKKNNARLNNGIRKLMVLLLIVIAAMAGYQIFKDQIMQIYERWMWQLKYASTSSLDFLTSNRIRRISGGFDLFLHGRVWYPFLGWGLGGEIVGMPNMEMDFLDLLFRTGIVGFSLVILFYYTFWKKNVIKNYWNNWILIWAAAVSFGAGHVLFYGQSGMAFALLFIFCTVHNSWSPLNIKQGKGY